MSASDRLRGTHPVSIGHLVTGLVFLGLAGAWALGAAGVVDADAAWVVPLVLVVAGGAGLLASVFRSLRSGRPDPEGSESWDRDEPWAG
jgi:hypothetical protein